MSMNVVPISAPNENDRLAPRVPHCAVSGKHVVPVDASVMSRAELAKQAFEGLLASSSFLYLSL